MRPFASRFLADMDSFPRLIEGEPQGNFDLYLELPGGPYRLIGLSREQAMAVGKRFGNLCSGASIQAGMPIKIFGASSCLFRPVDFTGEEYTFNRDFQPDVIRVAGQRFMARLELRAQAQAGLWLQNADELVSLGVLDNFLRICLAVRMLQAGGVLLHSAAVVKDGQVHIFIGRSGAGKSTISRLGLAAGLDVLSDDMNALVPGEDGRYWAEKLPFAGDLGQTATPKGRYPVAGIYRLEQACDNSVQPLSAAHAMAALLACAPYVNADPYRSDSLATNLEGLLASVPVRELRFNLDGAVWKLL